MRIISVLVVVVIAGNQFVDLFYTGNRLGALLPVDGTGVECGYCAECQDYSECFGGLTRMKYYMNNNATTANRMAIDVGGSLTGSLWFALNGTGLMSQVYDEAQLVATGLETLELDSGIAQFDRFIAETNGSVVGLGGNLAGGAPDALVGRKIIDFGGLKVGVIGVVEDLILTRIKNPSNMSITRPGEEALRAATGQLLEMGVSFIVAVVPGLFKDPDTLALWRSLYGVDVFLLMEVQTLPTEPMVVQSLAGTPMLLGTSSMFGRSFGHMLLEVDSFGRLVSWNCSVMSLPYSAPTEPVFETFLRNNWDTLNATYGNIVGSVSVPVPYDRTVCRSLECLPGIVTADALSWYARDVMQRPDISGSFLNAGSFSAGYSLGAVNSFDLFRSVPFSLIDEIYVISLTGKMFKDLFEHAVSVAEDADTSSVGGRFQQIGGGIRFAYNPNTNVGARVFNLEIDGSPVDPERVYFMITIDYVANGGDSLAAALNWPDALLSIDKLSVFLFDIMESNLRANSPLNPSVEGRIVLTDEVAPNATESSGDSASSNTALALSIILSIVIPLLALLALAVCIGAVIALCACACMAAALVVVAVLVIAVAGLLAAALVASGGAASGAAYTLYLRRSSRQRRADLQSLLDSYMADADYRELRVRDLQFAERIGSGAYGEVNRGYWRHAEVAIKTLHGNFVNENLLEAVRREARLMKRIGNHPNIVTLLGAVTRESDNFYIVTQYCERGALSPILLNAAIELNDVDMALMARDAARGLLYLHQEGVVHCDVAARNCLVNSNGTVLLSDFGSAVDLGGSSFTIGTSDVGPVRWLAPESIRKRVHSRASDCFMFGVLLWEITHRRMPYENREVVDVMFSVIQDGLRLKIAPNTPQTMARIMDSVWSADAADRMTMEDIVVELDAFIHHQNSAGVSVSDRAWVHVLEGNSNSTGSTRKPASAPSVSTIYVETFVDDTDSTASDDH